MKNDNALKNLLRSVDVQTTPPEGLKERIFGRVMMMEINVKPVLSPLERFFFEKPLRAACMIAILVAGSLWTIIGGSFVELLNGMIQ